VLISVTALTCVLGMLYLSASAYEESVHKEQEKIKALEEKFNAKILEHGVRIQNNI
jgi:hypothetical protein